ncbi:uncharacterized protein EI90DRAFT_3047664, partial [Cantharellus anzutake]|uniref:uncharacterized protein n=1 Tax=Cantharellus anzutake TaxID=1750568 RepID=UPI001902C94F
MKYGALYQHGPGSSPATHQQQASKPPSSISAPYGSNQSQHVYHPGQQSGYDDYSQSAVGLGDPYGKPQGQGQIYGQGLQNSLSLPSGGQSGYGSSPGHSRLVPSNGAQGLRVLLMAINSMRRRLPTALALRTRLSRISNRDRAHVPEASLVQELDLALSSSNRVRDNRLREDTSLTGTDNKLRPAHMVLPNRTITNNMRLNIGS